MTHQRDDGPDRDNTFRERKDDVAGQDKQHAAPMFSATEKDHCEAPPEPHDPPDRPAEDDLSSLTAEEPVTERLDKLAGVMGGVGAEVQRNTQLLERLLKRQELSTADSRQRRFDDLQWETQVLDPMANRLFPVFDLVLAYRSAYRKKGMHSAASAFKAVQDMFQEFLSTYRIEFFVVRKGAEFDPSRMKPMKVKPTPDPTQHRRVHACLRVGFRRERRVLRPASVVLTQCEARAGVPEHREEGRE